MVVLSVVGVLADGSVPVSQVRSPQVLHQPINTDSTLQVNVVDSAGAPVDLTGVTGAFSVQQYPDDTAPLITKPGTLAPGVGGISASIVDNSAVWSYLKAIGVTTAYLPTWASAGPSLNTLVQVGANLWVASTATGTTTGTTPPAGLSAVNPVPGTTVTDSSVTWTIVTSWQPNTTYTGSEYISSRGNVYLCGTGGVSAAPVIGAIDFPINANDTQSIGIGDFLYDVVLTFSDGSRAQVVPASCFVVDPSF